MKSASKTSSVCTRRRLELESVLLEEEAHVDVNAYVEKFTLRQKQRDTKREAQKKEQELATVKQQKELVIKLKKLEKSKK